MSQGKLEQADYQTLFSNPKQEQNFMNLMLNGSSESQNNKKSLTNGEVKLKQQDSKQQEDDSFNSFKVFDTSQSSLIQNFTESEMKIKENQEIAQELQLIAQSTDQMTKDLKESNFNNETFQQQFDILIQKKAQELKLIEQLQKKLEQLENQQFQQKNTFKSLVNQSIHTQESSEDVQLSYLNQSHSVLLIKQLKSNNRNSIMTTKQAIRLFEDFLIAKLQQDQIDYDRYKDSQKIKSSASYFFCFLKDQCQEKQEAYEKLSSFLNCLQKLFKDGHSYGTFICQLLQVYTADVIDQTFSQFITKFNQDFQTIQEIYEFKVKNERRKGNMNQINLSNKNSEVEMQGGEVPLQDVFNLLLNLFEKDFDVCQNIINSLCPKQKQQSNYQLYIACWKISKLGLPSEVFDLIDENKQTFLKRQRFTERIAEIQYMKFQQGELKTFLNYIDNNNTGYIYKNDFQEGMDMYQTQISSHSD